MQGAFWPGWGIAKVKYKHGCKVEADVPFSIQEFPPAGINCPSLHLIRQSVMIVEKGEIENSRWIHSSAALGWNHAGCEGIQVPWRSQTAKCAHGAHQKDLCPQKLLTSFSFFVRQGFHQSPQGAP